MEETIPHEKDGGISSVSGVSQVSSDMFPTELAGPASSSTIDTLKPEIPRRATDPIPRSISPMSSKFLPLSQKPRNRSPLARSHVRSRSTASLMTPPPTMTRAHSMPSVDFTSRAPAPTTQRPVSPLNGSGRRYRSPSRRFLEDTASLGVPCLPDIGENAMLDTEFDSTPRASDTSYSHSSPSLGLGQHNTFTRRYRPSSPLRSVPQSPSTASSHAPLPPKTPNSAGSSPLIQAVKFNEPYPVHSNYSISFLSSSSMPSTPTSIRSRSPSISSLETIPDSPDAEEAALEADNIARLKSAADAAEMEEAGEQGNDRRRSSIENSSSGGRAIGFGFGSRDKKKRWSVCGAERRGDLDQETIWED